VTYTQIGAFVSIGSFQTYFKIATESKTENGVNLSIRAVLQAAIFRGGEDGIQLFAFDVGCRSGDDVAGNPFPLQTRAHFGTNTNNGRANLPVCPNLTASQRGDAGGSMGIRTQEHRSARSCGNLGGASAYVSLQRDKAAPALPWRQIAPRK
jgi:hypothetical protein